MNTPALPVLAAFYPSRLAHRCSGWLVMLTLAAALGLLVDGLLAEMRAGPDMVDAIVGEDVLLSGNIPLKNAAKSDFVVLGQGPDVPVSLTLDDYFPSYWFGSGMWRAKLSVPATAAPGRYSLVVAFKGATPQSARRLLIAVWQSPEDMRQHAYAWTWRTLGVKPFPAAAVAGSIGLLLALLNFLLGWRYGRLLAANHLSEIFLLTPLGRGRVEVVCGLPAGLSVAPGLPVDAFRQNGNWRCSGSVSKVEGGRIRCFWDEADAPAIGDVLRLEPEKTADGGNAAA